MTATTAHAASAGAHRTRLDRRPPPTGPSLGASQTQTGVGRWAWLLLAAILVAVAMPRTSSATATTVPVRVVIEGAGSDAAALTAAVHRVGGKIVTPLGLIGGVVADVPADAVDALRRLPAVAGVTPDRSVRLAATRWGDTSSDSEPGTTQSSDPATSETSSDTTSEQNSTSADGQPLRHDLAAVARDLGLPDRYATGALGQGIDIALIDSGILPVEGLTGPRFRHGPDLSYEAGNEDLRHLDTFGHGTHLAGVIAADAEGTAMDGLAPRAGLVSVKVATATGATDVSQVIAALDWVVEHGRRDGLNVRVVSLSFGTDGTAQDWQVDPLAHAVEAAWRAGFVVVVSAGNNGEDVAQLTNPAINPNVIAVGASDPNGTPADRRDDVIPAWSAHSSDRGPDLVAPGRSVVSLRAPGSMIDELWPQARVGEHGFVGSGTSQAAAAVAAASAVLLSENPGLTPDEVKAILTGGATKLNQAGRDRQGAGVVTVDDKGMHLGRKQGLVTWQSGSTGSGSIEASRGSAHVELSDGSHLEGEVIWTGGDWDPDAVWDGATWSGGTWSGATWSGATWSGATWSGGTWSGATWSGATWSGGTWSGATWSGATWSGATWSGATWSGATWSGDHWAGVTWN